MKLTMRIGAAIGIVALAGCNQSGGQENASTADTEIAVNETVLPPDDAGGEVDTLGNQLDQLNQSGSDATNEASNSSADN